MRYLAGWIAIAVVAGAGCWFFGLTILSAVVVALVIVAVGFTFSVVASPAGNRDWPAIPALPADGTRRESAELSWAMRTRSGVVDEPVVDRVRTIAAGVLARRYLELDNPAHRTQIVSLLGPQAYTLLNPARVPRRPRVNAILSALARIEALEHLD